MILLSILALVCLLLGIVASMTLYRTIGCPLGVFSICWNGLFFLYTLNFNSYYEISSEAAIIIMGSFIIYLIGSVTHQLPRSKLLNKTRPLDRTKPKVMETLDRGINLAITLSLVGGGLWLLQVIVLMGLGNIFSLDAYMFRYRIMPQINIVFSYLINTFGLGGSVLIGLKLIKLNDFKFKYLLVLMGPLTVALFTQQRALIIISMLCIMSPFLVSGVSSDQTKRSIKRKHIIQGSSFLVVFFLVIGFIRGSFVDFQGNTNIFSNMFYKTYGYLTGSFVAFSEKMDVIEKSYGLGVNTFTPLAKLTNLIGVTKIDSTIINSIESGREPVLIPYDFNVYTYLLDIIGDFGVLGLLIFTWILGYGSSYLWGKSNDVNKVVTLNDVTLSLVTVYLLYGFIASITSYSIVWYGFIYAYIVIIISQNRRKLSTNKLYSKA